MRSPYLLLIWWFTGSTQDLERRFRLCDTTVHRYDSHVTQLTYHKHAVFSMAQQLRRTSVARRPQRQTVVMAVVLLCLACSIMYLERAPRQVAHEPGDGLTASLAGSLKSFPCRECACKAPALNTYPYFVSKPESECAFVFCSKASALNAHPYFVSKPWKDYIIEHLFVPRQDAVDANLILLGHCEYQQQLSAVCLQVPAAAQQTSGVLCLQWQP